MIDNLNLLKHVQQIAKQKHGNHFTLFSFTTHFKGMYGTPDFQNMGEFSSFIASLPAYKTMEELLYMMAETPHSFEFKNLIIK